MSANENTEPNIGAQVPEGDYIVRATAKGGKIRAFACRTTELCREAVRIHGLSPIAAAALGRLMSGVLMMTQDLKNDDDTITAIVRGDGPLGGMTVVGNAQAGVRGYCHNPAVPSTYHKPGKLNVGEAVGQGTLTIIKDMGLKEAYTGKVELISGEIAEDITYYLAVSEQTPSAVSLGVSMDKNGVMHAGGMIIQLMPDASDDLIDWLEQRIGGFPEISYLMEEGFDPHQILDLLFGDPDIQYHQTTKCSYSCPCSRERMERNLLTLGLDDLNHLAADPAGIELECHFCDRKYNFSNNELNGLIEQLTQK